RRRSGRSTEWVLIDQARTRCGRWSRTSLRYGRRPRRRPLWSGRIREVVVGTRELRLYLPPQVVVRQVVVRARVFRFDLLTQICDRRHSVLVNYRIFIGSGFCCPTGGGILPPPPPRPPRPPSAVAGGVVVGVFGA